MTAALFVDGHSRVKISSINFVCFATGMGILTHIAISLYLAVALYRVIPGFTKAIAKSRPKFYGE